MPFFLEYLVGIQQSSNRTGTFSWTTHGTQLWYTHAEEICISTLSTVQEADKPSFTICPSKYAMVYTRSHREFKFNNTDGNRRGIPIAGADQYRVGVVPGTYGQSPHGMMIDCPAQDHRTHDHCSRPAAMAE